MHREFEVTIRSRGGDEMERSVSSRSTSHAIAHNGSPVSHEEHQHQEEPSEEAMRTLWVGGLSDKVEADVLYELFLNMGPISRVSHPIDRETKKKKPFAFIVFEDPESIKYAYDVINGVELYGQKLRLQHKETGLGFNNGGVQAGRFGPHHHQQQQYRGNNVSMTNYSHSMSSLPRHGDQHRRSTSDQQMFNYHNGGSSSRGFHDDRFDDHRYNQGGGYDQRNVYYQPPPPGDSGYSNGDFHMRRERSGDLFDRRDRNHHEYNNDFDRGHQRNRNNSYRDRSHERDYRSHRR